MSNVVLKNVRKVYDKNVIIKSLNLEIKDKEFVVLVGASGCGKSTILRMIAGLEEITDGEIYIGDKKVNDIPPKDRDIAFVFQSYALYPHMTVRERSIGNFGFDRTFGQKTETIVRRSKTKSCFGQSDSP